MTGDIQRHTLLTDFNTVYDVAAPELRRAFTRSAWRIPSYAGGMYCSFRFAHDQQRGWRWDRNAMVPANNAAKAVADQMDSVLEAVPLIRYQWSHEVALVIDNWRVLHGRGQRPAQENRRELHRVYVG
ncbi:MAG TPA: hypothetical protein VHO25_01030 [Polyangiaceae bacterium]|nr:hypothetical protein [Polyangiaceae bacterium]